MARLGRARLRLTASGPCVRPTWNVDFRSGGRLLGRRARGSRHGVPLHVTRRLRSPQSERRVNGGRVWWLSVPRASRRRARAIHSETECRMSPGMVIQINKVLCVVAGSFLKMNSPACHLRCGSTSRRESTRRHVCGCVDTHVSGRVRTASGRSSPPRVLYAGAL